MDENKELEGKDLWDEVMYDFFPNARTEEEIEQELEDWDPEQKRKKKKTRKCRLDGGFLLLSL